MIEPILVLDNVMKRINKQIIIHPMDLTQENGSVMALCGGNGAGKSTILRMIAGITRPTSGEITVSGTSWEFDRSAYAQKIGFMPDDFHFGLSLSAGESLQFYASLRGLSASRVEEALHMVGLWEERKRKVSMFSKGMKQRLLFAQSVLASPQLLILDEPTNGLDPYWMDSFVQLVAGLKQAGQAVIFSTHQLQVAEAVADHVVFLGEGRVVGAGTVEQFKSEYGSKGLHGAFTALAKKKLLADDSNVFI